MACRIRIATYNIHKCRGLDRRIKPARIVEVLREVNADLIALQEVLSVQGDPQWDHVRVIAAELGLDYCFGENRRLYGGGYGNLMLSRFPMQAVRNYDITAGRREARGCLRADVEIGGAIFHFFNIHLGTGFLERRQQAHKLVSSKILLSPELHGPRIVLGDLNEWPQGLTSRLLSAHLDRRHLHRPRTYPGLFPIAYLDHIYCDPPIILERLRLHRSRAAFIASDHLPLVGDFRLDLATAKPSLVDLLPRYSISDRTIYSV